MGSVDSDQPSFTDVEYGNRRRISRRERFLEQMNATGTRDPEMKQTKKDNQWYFGMKAHSVTATAASVPRRARQPGS